MLGREHAIVQSDVSSKDRRSGLSGRRGVEWRSHIAGGPRCRRFRPQRRRHRSALGLALRRQNCGYCAIFIRDSIDHPTKWSPHGNGQKRPDGYRSRSETGIKQQRVFAV